MPDDSYPLAVYRWFQKYLDFKGRGIPRRVIRGLNEYVLWTQFRPYLAFSRQDVRRFRFYAGIQEVLEASERRLFEDTPEEIRSTRHDRRRLGVYYLIDWILRQGPAEFTLQDAVNASRRLSSQIAPAEEVAPQAAQQICQMLLQNGYLEEVRPNLAEVQIGQVDAKDKRYRLAPRRLSEMNALVGAFESEIYAMQPAGALPERLGRYRIVSLEGQGGTSTVYRAWDEALGREVGLKVLRAYYALDPVGLERFHREAQVMASLRHPNIVRMYEIGQDRSNWFIAMEWVDGRSLDTLIRSLGRLDPAAALQIAIPAAGALGYVHGQGIVRNDVKPGNILISRAGQVLLTDFGISKRLDAGSAITSASLMIGTPFYMSPEQCEGLPADARSDLYALGAVLYEMVTGFPPFRGDTAFEVIMAHINQPPQPPSRAVDVPPALEAVILKCLEKDPDRRYQSMGELSQAIEASLPDRPEVDLASLVGTVDAQARRVAETDQARTEVGAGAGLNSGSLEPEAGVSEPVQVPPHAPAPPAVAASPAKPPVPNALTPRPSIGAPQAAPVLAAGIPRPTEAPDVFSAQPPPAPHEAETAGLARHPSLEIVGSGEHPQVFRFPPKAVRIRIGRVSDSDLVLTELKVSRHHAAIECREGIWTIEDLNTANGTFLNGYRIVEQAPLAPGDRIGIGEAVLIFR